MASEGAGEVTPLELGHPSDPADLVTEDPAADVVAEEESEEEEESPEKVEKPSYDGSGVGLLFDRRMARHRNLDEDDHPEQPLRILRIWERLVAEGIAARCVRIPCREAERQELELKHTAAHVDSMLAVAGLASAEACRLGRTYNSVYLCRRSTRAALLSAGSVLEATERVCSGDVLAAACVVRPPGHHCERDRPMGFCLFGNVGLAAAEARARGWSQRTLIVDWDVHHGNGTQRMFESDGSVLFFSVHRHDNGYFYPGGIYGHYTSHGTADGEGFSVNVPWDVRGGIRKANRAPGDEGHLGQHPNFDAFARVLLPIAADFRPDLVLVSAGFDAAEGDPLGGCHVTPAGYHRLTSELMGLAGGRVVLALEGGYNLEQTSADVPLSRQTSVSLAQSFHAATVSEVVRHLAQFWPSLCTGAGGEPPARPEPKLPAAALCGSVAEMEAALRAYGEDREAGYDYHDLASKQQAQLFRLGDVPEPPRGAGQGAGWAALRDRLAPSGAAAEPPFVLPVVEVCSPERAVESAGHAYSAGAHGVWLVNRGHAHSPEEAALEGPPAPQLTSVRHASGHAGGATAKAGKAQLAALQDCFAAVREAFPDWWLGLSVPQLPPAQVFKWVSSHCPSAGGVWLDDLPARPADISWDAERGHALRLEKWLPDSQPALKAVKRERQQASSWPGLVFGGVAGPRQQPAHHEQDQEHMGQACLTILRHWACLAASACDVVVTGGRPRGSSCRQAKARALEGVLPLAVLSCGEPGVAEEW
ncbi:unnamed protein product, partial [Prorocentrum cordatum]